jgi:predicted RNase H-like HicB family nuclease
MSKYLIIIEKTNTGYSAYSPDLPGCVATGKSRQQTEHEMKEAIEFHIEGLRLHGYEVPQPSSIASYCEVAAFELTSLVSAGHSVSKGNSMAEKPQYIERRPEGDYAIRQAGSQRASDVQPTQQKAIERAKELRPNAPLHVERVRDTSGGNRDKWRKV